MTEANDAINRSFRDEIHAKNMRNAALLFGSKEQQQPTTSTGQPVPPGAGPDARESENAGMNRAILRSMGYPTPGDR